MISRLLRKEAVPLISLSGPRESSLFFCLVPLPHQKPLKFRAVVPVREPAGTGYGGGRVRGMGRLNWAEFCLLVYN